MKPKAAIKITVDILITIALFTQMAFYITGEGLHEWTGAAMFALFIVHHILNWAWVKNLHRGKYNAYRIVQLAMNLLLFLSMIGLMVSGILLSRQVFAFVRIAGTTAFARSLHHVSAYWGFVVMSAHIGQHWGMVMGMTRRGMKTVTPSGKRRIVLRIMAVLIALYGVYAFVTRQFPQYMTNRIEYSFFDYSQPAALFFLDYVAIMGLFVCIGHYATRWVQRNAAISKRVNS